MGNVACCKKPNEIIEDKDLLKQKSTLKRNELLNKNILSITCEQNPFIKSNITEKPIINLNINTDTNSNTNINTNTIEEENKIIIDLEKNNLEHKPTGPSDNMRRRKQKNIQNKNQPSKDIKYNENNTNNINNLKKNNNGYEQNVGLNLFSIFSR